MIELPDEEILHELVDRLDDLLSEFHELGTHNLAGVLLSRVVFLTQSQPSLGKDLVRYVWEKLDEIEQNNPGDQYD